MSNLLVVDWDFFFPVVERPEDEAFPMELVLYDWGHSEEDRFFYERVWDIRARYFIERGLALPAIDRVAAEAFWRRFDFAHGARLYYADSNMYAFHETVREGVDTVWLYDAHHDAGYEHDAIERLLVTKQVTCDNWMLAYAATDVALHMRYPAWRHYAADVEPEPLIPLDREVDDGTAPPVVFDRVFVARSPAWVPSWCDRDFQRFLVASGLRRRRALDDSVLRRSFDRAAVERLIAEGRAAPGGLAP